MDAIYQLILAVSILAVSDFSWAQCGSKVLYGVQVYPVTYTIQDGNFYNSTVSLVSSQDTTYNGSRDPNGTLSGGLGKLTDGYGNKGEVFSNSTSWVRWNVSKLQMDFSFAEPISLCQVNLQLPRQGLRNWFFQVFAGSEGLAWGDISGEYVATLTGVLDVVQPFIMVPILQKKIHFRDQRPANRTLTNFRINIEKDKLFALTTGPEMIAISEVTFYSCACPQDFQQISCDSSSLPSSPCLIHLGCARHPSATCWNNYCSNAPHQLCRATYILNKTQVTCEPDPTTQPTTTVKMQSSSSSSQSSSSGAGSGPSQASEELTGFIIAIAVLGALLLVFLLLLFLRSQYYRSLHSKNSNAANDKYSALSLSKYFTDSGTSTLERSSQSTSQTTFAANASETLQYKVPRPTHLTYRIPPSNAPYAPGDLSSPAQTTSPESDTSLLAQSQQSLGELRGSVSMGTSHYDDPKPRGKPADQCERPLSLTSEGNYQDLSPTSKTIEIKVFEETAEDKKASNGILTKHEEMADDSKYVNIDASSSPGSKTASPDQLLTSEV